MDYSFSRRSFLSVGASSVVSAAPEQAAGQTAPKPLFVPAGDPVFLLESSTVEDTWRVRRKVNPLVKSPRNPIMVGDRPWEGYGPFMHGTVLYDPDDKLFKCWYQVFDNEAYREQRAWFSGICYAVSDDGYRWRKPQLGIMEYQGSKQNNMIRLGKEYAQAISVRIAPPGSGVPAKFIALYLDKPGVSLAFSDNGTEWTYPSSNPVEPSMSDDHNVLLFDQHRKIWMVYHRPPLYAGNWKRRRSLIESRDLKNWTRYGVVFGPDEADPPEFMVMPVFQRGNLFFGLLALYDQSRGANEVELVFSADGRTWNRVPPREHFIPMGPRGDWDSGSIFLGSHPVIVGDEMRFYYAAFDTDHECLFPSLTEAIGVGSISLDRFFGLEHSTNVGPGDVLTRPLSLEGNVVEVNADVPGSLRVQVMDSAGRAVPGFSLADCRTITGDSLRHRVSWSGGRFPFTDRSLRLKFELQGEATLYSFSVRRA